MLQSLNVHIDLNDFKKPLQTMFLELGGEPPPRHPCNPPPRTNFLALVEGTTIVTGGIICPPYFDTAIW